jgi:atypical dual specificity phosphatase
MDRFALTAPKSVVRLAGHVLFWPIALSQHVMHRLGWFAWYSEIVKLPNGGRLLLGGLPWPRSMCSQLLETEKVDRVVNLVSEKKIDLPSVKTLHVPMEDFLHPNIDQVRSAVNFLESSLIEGKTVYVHCRAGKGRSATVVMCWLVAHMHMSPESAQEFLLKKRPHVLSNLKDRDVVHQFVPRNS